MEHKDLNTEKKIDAKIIESSVLLQVLQDRLLENQTEADFTASAGPKALATHHLDVLSRRMCPHLRHFVVFSSLACGYGNAGQTNYGMSNSIMERICEARVSMDSQDLLCSGVLWEMWGWWQRSKRNSQKYR